mmetsp:Transcript_125981/g.228648  ORF Transcript_125981/g.228648 Transcript_125981/m.228648 type:complete len:98 (-) Transcript_125981:176-469(-)
MKVDVMVLQLQILGAKIVPEPVHQLLSLRFVRKLVVVTRVRRGTQIMRVKCIFAHTVVNETTSHHASQIMYLLPLCNLEAEGQWLGFLVSFHTCTKV